LAGHRARRLGVATVDELDGREDELERGPGGVGQRPLFAAPRTIELPPRVHVGGGGRATECALGERGHNLTRAAFLLPRGRALCWLTQEDLAAAGGVGRALRVERTLDRHLTDVRIE